MVTSIILFLWGKRRGYRWIQTALQWFSEQTDFSGLHPAYTFCFHSGIVLFPTFIGAVLGVTFGVTGVMKWFLAQPVSSVYLGCEQLIVAPLNAMILLAVGYDIDLHLEKIREVLKPVISRLLIQSCAIAVVVFAISRLYKGDLQFIIAEVIYMSVPTTFSMQTYIKDPEGCSYVSTTNSVYMIITIIAYAICAYIYNLA